MIFLLGLASSTLAMELKMVRPALTLGSLGLLSQGPQGGWGTQVDQYGSSGSSLPYNLDMEPLPGNMGSQECTTDVCRYDLQEAKIAADALLKTGNRVQFAAPCGHHYNDGRLIEDTCHYPGTMIFDYEEGDKHLHIDFDHQAHIPAGEPGRLSVPVADKDKVTALSPDVHEPNAFQKACQILHGAEVRFGDRAGAGPVCRSFRDLLESLIGATPTNNGDCRADGCGDPANPPRKGAFVNGVLLISGMTQAQAKQAHDWLRHHDDGGMEPTYWRESSHPGMDHGVDFPDPWGLGSDYITVYRCSNDANRRGQKGKGCKAVDKYRTSLLSVPKPYEAGDRLNWGESSLAREGDDTYKNGVLREFAYGDAQYANKRFFMRIKPESWGMNLKKPYHVTMHGASYLSSKLSTGYKKKPQYYGDGDRIKGNGNGCLTVNLDTSSVYASGELEWIAKKCQETYADSQHVTGLKWTGPSGLLSNRQCNQVNRHIPKGKKHGKIPSQKKR